jgi:outer membrane receptor for ferrienterochelin and colicins
MFSVIFDSDGLGLVCRFVTTYLLGNLENLKKEVMIVNNTRVFNSTQKTLNWVFLLFLGVLPFWGMAQKVSGTVSDIRSEPLAFVNLLWANTNVGASTDEKGSFKIDKPDQYPALLVVSYVGFKTDTIKVWENMKKIKVVLKSNVELKEVEVTSRQTATNIGTISTDLVEALNQDELRKAACCSVSESFGTNASVDVNVTDAVSGSKKIKMLGLDGIYTQIQFENLPLVRGLASSNGLDFIPGTWVESIQIKKGAGSVVNGYESIAGQINIEFLKPDEAEKLFVNVYANEMGRLEFNTHLSKKINDKWSTLFFVHAANQAVEIDRNDDSFLDLPLKNTAIIFNRWKYFDKNFRLQFGVRGVFNDLKAGQKNDMDNPYKVDIKTTQVYGFVKTGYLFDSENSFGIVGKFKYHEHLSTFGLTNYNADQTNFYLNAVYADELINENHKIKTGVSLNYDSYTHQFNDSSFTNLEIVPGAFFEYAYVIEKISVVAGIRGDHHNQFGGFISPRLHFKYNVTPRSALRLSAGKGFRTANVLIENSSYLVSSRQVRFENGLQPEQAWNYGVSYSQKFTLGEEVELAVNADYYYTDFENQVVVDVEDVNYVSFYNLNGQSYSHAIQAEATLTYKRAEIKTAYKYLDVMTQYGSDLKSKPYTPKNRVLVNVGYRSKFDKYKFDLTTLWTGLSRVPSTAGNAEGNERSNSSETYFLLNGQVTRKFRTFELYIGGENLLNFKQKNPIIDSENPFGDNFDASMIWGPVQGRVVYAGFRFAIK